MNNHQNIKSKCAESKERNTKEWFGWNSERSWKTCALCCLKNADELSFDPHFVHGQTVQKWGVGRRFWNIFATLFRTLDWVGHSLRRKALCSPWVRSSFMTSLWGRVVFGNYSSPRCYQYQHQEPWITQWLETLIDMMRYWYHCAHRWYPRSSY